MRAVLIGIGKYDYFVVIEISNVEIRAYARTERAYYGTDFFVFKHFFYAFFLGIERFAAERQYRLMLTVSALFRAAARGIALDDKYFVEFCFTRSTVGKFADKFCGLCQPDFAVALLRAAKERGLATAMESTGFAEFSVISRYLPYLDTYLMDIKHIDSKKHEEFTTRPCGTDYL